MQQNVVKLKNDYVYGDILTYLENLASESQNTETSYRKAITDFFYYTRNKKLDELVVEDLKYRHSEIVDYQNYLKNKLKFKGKTVNAKMQAIRSLFKILKKEEEYDFIRVESFDVKRLKETDTKKYGFFYNVDEAVQYVESAKELANGEMKSILIDLAIHTSLRKCDLIIARPCDFKQDRTYKDIWIYHATNTKGKRKLKRPITERLWKRIENYVLNNGIGYRDQIFKISERHIDHELERLNELMKIDPERNIKFHSLRKVASVYEIDENNDIYAAQKAMDHKKVDTTLEIYYDRMEDHSKASGVTMEQNVDISLLGDLSKDELLDLIERCCNKKTKSIMNDKAKDIISDNVKHKVVEENEAS